MCSIKHWLGWQCSYIHSFIVMRFLCFPFSELVEPKLKTCEVENILIQQMHSGGVDHALGVTGDTSVISHPVQILNPAVNFVYSS